MDLEEDVAELVEQLCVVAGGGGVGELVGLLDRVGDDRALVLLAVPGALAPQAPGDLVEPRDRLRAGSRTRRPQPPARSPTGAVGGAPVRGAPVGGGPAAAPCRPGRRRAGRQARWRRRPRELDAGAGALRVSPCGGPSGRCDVSGIVGGAGLDRLRSTATARRLRAGRRPARPRAARSRRRTGSRLGGADASAGPLGDEVVLEVGGGLLRRWRRAAADRASLASSSGWVFSGCPSSPRPGRSRGRSRTARRARRRGPRRPAPRAAGRPGPRSGPRAGRRDPWRPGLWEYCLAALSPGFVGGSPSSSSALACSTFSSEVLRITRTSRLAACVAP